MAEAPPPHPPKVSVTMWKALCCRRPAKNQVNDAAAASNDSETKKAVAANGTAGEKAADEPVTMQPGGKNEEVFLFFSYALIQRGLLGRLLKGLERKQLRMATMELGPVAQEKLEKLFASRRGLGKKNAVATTAPSVLITVKGDDAFRRVNDTCTDFGRDHALTRCDLVWSTNATQTKKDLAIFFTPKVIMAIPPSPLDVPPPGGDDANAPTTGMPLDDPAQEVDLDTASKGEEGTEAKEEASEPTRGEAGQIAA